MAGAATLPVTVARPIGVLRQASWRHITVALLALNCLVCALSHRSFALLVFGDLSQCVLLAITTFVFAANAGHSSGRVRVFWALLTSGAALWLFTSTLWCFYEVALRREVPNPFAGDIVLFLHVVPMMAAFILQPNRPVSRRYATLGLPDLALLASWWLYLYMLVVIPWQYVTVNVIRYGSNFDRAYLVENLLFIGVAAAALVRSSGQWRRFYAQFLGAIILYTLASAVAGAAIDSGRYYTGSWYDLPIYAAITVLVWIAAPAARLEPQRASERELTAKPPFWAARIASLAVVSIPVLAWIFIVQTGAPAPIARFRLLLTLAASLVIAAMVAVKQHLFSHELLRLADEATESCENLRRVQNQLVQSEKLAALGQLVAGAAHEINNPLTAIIGYCELLPEFCADPAALAQKIGQQARRTKALVENLISFARQAPANKVEVDLTSAASSALRLLQHELVQHRVNAVLNQSGAPALPPVLADPNQLLQVIMQVLRNAIESLALVGGGELKLATFLDDAAAVLEVTDSGPGIRAPEKVFDPFYTTKPVGQGTGLGLSTAYGIIQGHNGEITCRNNPAGGATFRIALPLARPAA
ncbi:MAG TPA: ATP-binding protein [Terriglobales bacterium]|nr:ATP-binding protein [Terriglobales bacterium]